MLEMLSEMHIGLHIEYPLLWSTCNQNLDIQWNLHLIFFDLWFSII